MQRRANDSPSSSANHRRQPSSFLSRTIVSACQQPLLWYSLPIAMWIYSTVAVNRNPHLIRLYAMAFPYVRVFPGVPVGPEATTLGARAGRLLRALLDGFSHEAYKEQPDGASTTTTTPRSSTALLLTCFTSVLIIPDLREMLRAMEGYSLMSTFERRGISPYTAFRDTVGAFVSAGVGNLLFLSLVERLGDDGAWRPFYWTSFLRLAYEALKVAESLVRPVSAGTAADLSDLAATLTSPPAGAASTTSSSSSSVAYLCGGGAYGYAFSGFRCGYGWASADAYLALSNMALDALGFYLSRYPHWSALWLSMTDVIGYFIPLDEWQRQMVAERQHRDSSLSHVFSFAAIQGACLASFVGGVLVGRGLAQTERALPLRYLHWVWPWLARLVGEPLPPLAVPELLIDVAQPNAGVVEVTLEDVRAAEQLGPRPPAPDGRLRSWCVGIPAGPDLFCPISRTLMADPVRAGDHFVYDRESILTWWQSGALTSPMTNLELTSEALAPDTAVRAQLEVVVKAYQDWRAMVLNDGEAPTSAVRARAHGLASALRQWPLALVARLAAR